MRHARRTYRSRLLYATAAVALPYCPQWAFAGGRWRVARGAGQTVLRRAGADLGIVSDLLGAPTSVPALNPGSTDILRAVVWTDFRLAVVFFVIAPLLLLLGSIWSSVQSNGRDDRILRMMSGYWQSSSLLLVTVLLNVAETPIGAVTGLVAQAMILVSLWFWEDLNEDITKKPGLLATCFQLWRLVTTFVATIGVVAQIPFQYCATASRLSLDDGCAAWLEPPLAFKAFLVPQIQPEISGQIGLAALAVYASYLAYFLVRVLPQIGRRGLAPRGEVFTWLSPLQALGLVSSEGSSPMPPRD